MTAMKRIEWDRITAVSAIIIAIASLVVSITEMRDNKTFRRVEMTPSIGIDQGIHPDAGFHVEITNVGLGHAKLKWFKVFVDSQEVSDWYEAFAVLGLNSEAFDYRNVNSDVILRPNPGMSSFIFQAQEPEFARKLWQEHYRFSFVICSCSLFGDCEINSTARDLSELKSRLSTSFPNCISKERYPLFFAHYSRLD